MIAQQIWSAEQWLELFKNRYNTWKSYHFALRKFIKLIYPDELKEDCSNLNELSLRYFEEERDCRLDVLKFKNSMSSLAPKSVATKLAAIRGFLEHNGVTFSRRFFVQMNGKKDVEAISKEVVPDKEKLRKLMDCMPYHAKIWVYVAAVSGLRLGEMKQIKEDNVDLNSNPVRIRVPSSISKNGRSRITFVTPIAAELLRDWLEQKNVYLDIDKRYKKQNRDRVFPFKIQAIWVNALKQCGLYERDSQTGRLTLRPHNLKKYFYTYGKWSSQDAVQALMGHKRGLSAIYGRFDQAEQILEDAYRSATPNLEIFDGQRVGVEVQQLNKEQEAEITVLRKCVVDLSAQMDELWNRIFILMGPDGDSRSS